MIVQRMCKNLENQGIFPIIDDENESERLAILEFTKRPVNKHSLMTANTIKPLKYPVEGLQRLGFRSLEY